jgi:hypothetical protein
MLRLDALMYRDRVCVDLDFEAVFSLIDFDRFNFLTVLH